jgi:hypothetical protein
VTHYGISAQDIDTTLQAVVDAMGQIG